MPYLAPSQYKTEVVGESKYQKAIKEAILYKDLVDKDDMDFSWEKLSATIILDDNNKFDPGNAVRIEMDGETVGYLDKQDASIYRKQITKLNITEPCTCKAAVYGKRETLGKPMNFGVWLFIDLQRGIQIGEPPKRKKLFGIF